MCPAPKFSQLKKHRSFLSQRLSVAQAAKISKIEMVRGLQLLMTLDLWAIGILRNDKNVCAGQTVSVSYAHRVLIADANENEWELGAGGRGTSLVIHNFAYVREGEKLLLHRYRTSERPPGCGIRDTVANRWPRCQHNPIVTCRGVCFEKKKRVVLRFFFVLPRAFPVLFF